MCNQDIKEEFIEKSKDVYKAFLMKHFKAIERYEKGYEKDVATFSTEEIIKMYTDFNFVVAYTRRLNSLLRSYTDFYFSKKKIYDCENHYSEINTETIRKFVLKKPLLNYRDIIEAIEEIPNPCDAFLIYGIFYGISGSPLLCEISLLKKSNIKEDGMIITLPGIDPYGEIIQEARSIVADELLYDLAKKAADEYTYISGNSYGQYNKKMYTDKIVKPIGDNSSSEDLPSSYIRIRRKIVSLSKKYFGEAVTANDIKWSGIIYNMKVLMIQTNSANLFDVLKTPEFDKIAERYNITNKANRVRASVRQYMNGV